MSAETAFVIAAASGLAAVYLAAYVLARIPRDIREFKRLSAERRTSMH